MNWDEFRAEWRDILAGTPGLEEAIFLMTQGLAGETYDQGWDEGREEGFEDGYDAGFERGRDEGFEDGYEAGCVDCRED